MKSIAREINRDSNPLFNGTHKGASSSSALRDPGVNFLALGVNPDLDLYAENETQGTSGTVTDADENTVTVSGVTWDYGDEYSIYKTSTKNSVISSIYTDVSAGHKVTDPREVNRDGWQLKDVDIDDHGKRKVFGPGQPETN